jgi:hypothetical protein
MSRQPVSQRGRVPLQGRVLAAVIVVHEEHRQCGAVVSISEALLRQSQLPNPVVTASGQQLVHPSIWQ